MRSLLAFLALAAAVHSAEIRINPGQSDVILRPGATLDVTYSMSGWAGTYSIATLGKPAGLTISATIGNSAGTLHLTTAANIVSGSWPITVQAQSGTTTFATDTFTCNVDAPPVRPSTPVSISVAEDGTSLTRIDFIEPRQLSFDITGNQFVAASVRSATAVACSITLTPLHDYHGTTSITLTVTDDFGPTDFIYPVTVTPTNDPPVITLDAIADARMDPASGLPVAIVRSIAIGPGVDSDVTLSAVAGTVTGRLGWTASVDGTSGVDLLSLHGDATYLLAGGNITSTTGAVLATWTRAPTDTRRLSVSLATAGTQAQLEQLVRLLQFSHLQSTATELTRTLSIKVDEPESDGSPAISNTVTNNITVSIQNLPPVVTPQTITLAPEQSTPIDLIIADDDPDSAIQVRLTDPPLTAGIVQPRSCSYAELKAGRMSYTHTNPDEAVDRITLIIDDGHQQPVTATIPVTVRIAVERMSIISDPCLTATRDVTVDWPLQFSCALASAQIGDLGSTLPGLPVGSVAVQSGKLVFNWNNIPAETIWLPLQITATTDSVSDMTKRTAIQRMLIRVLPRPPVAMQP